MSGHPGYLLPDGDAYTDEMACCLVFYPDKEEYRRALLGSLVYLSTWLAWERDPDKRGKDAARSWKNAVDLTLECWNMACLEDLIADVAQIRQLMETKKDCCDANTSYFPPTIPPTEIQPLVGDAPEFYGETAIADWDEWAEHVCFNAHAYVDYLKDTSYQLNNAVNISSIFLGLISSALVLLAFSGIGLPIAFGLAASVVTGIALVATATTFSSTSSDFEAARQDIVCAIVSGLSLPDAIETALSSGTDWDLFYQFVDYESAITILYEGGHDTDYLPTEMRDDCDVCDAERLFEWTWDTDTDGFDQCAALTPTWVPAGHLALIPNTDQGSRFCVWWPWDEIETEFGLTLPIEFDQIRFKFLYHTGGGSFGHWEFSIRVSGLTAEWSENFHTDNYATEVWHEVVWNLGETFTSGETNTALRFLMERWQEPTHDQRIWFDDFGFYKR